MDVAPPYASEAGQNEMSIDSADELLVLSAAKLWKMESGGGMQLVASGPAKVVRYHITRPGQIRKLFLPILNVGETDVPLLPQLRVNKHGDCAFIIPSQQGTYRLELLQESLGKRQALEELLAYYTVFELAGMRNQAAVVNRTTGEVMGLLSGVRGPDDIMTEVADKIVPVVLEQGSVVTAGTPHNAVEHADPSKAGTVRSSVDRMLQGSEALSRTLVNQAEKFSVAISKKASSVKSTIVPSQTPVKVDIVWKKRVSEMRSYSKAIATTTSFMTKMVLGAIDQMGTLLSRAVPIDAKKDPKLAEVRYALAKSLLAAGNVLDGIEQSVKIVGSSSGKASIELLSHKYGDEVGDVLNEAADVAGDLVVVYFDARGLSRKALIKASAITMLNTKDVNKPSAN